MSDAGTIILAGLGLTLVIEGVVLALLPSRLEDLIAALQDLPIDARRIMGLLAVTFGLALVWFAVG